MAGSSPGKTGGGEQGALSTPQVFVFGENGPAEPPKSRGPWRWSHQGAAVPGLEPAGAGGWGLAQRSWGALDLPAPNPLRVPMEGFDVFCSGLEGAGWFGAGHGAFCWWMKPTWGGERGAGLGSSPQTQEREHCRGLMGYSLLPAELGRGKKIPENPPAAAALPPASKQATHRGSPPVTWMARCRVAGRERSLGSVPQHPGCALSPSLLAANPRDGCARHPGTDPAPAIAGGIWGRGWGRLALVALQDELLRLAWPELSLSQPQHISAASSPRTSAAAVLTGAEAQTGYGGGEAHRAVPGRWGA